MCIPPSPKGALWIRFLKGFGLFPLPKCNPAKQGKALPMTEPHFPLFPNPTEIWRGSGMLGGGTRVPEGTASCNARPSLPIYDL